jgi:DNA-binding transcriptional MerR regulator
MPPDTETKPKPSQESWRDWLGPDAPDPSPDELLTRDEVAQQANAWLRNRKPITPRDLLLWEQLGILPRGIRRRHKGASRNIYPRWVSALARDIRELQHQGLSLETIRMRIRNRARIEMGIGATLVDEAIRRLAGHAETPEDLTMLPPVLAAELDRLATMWTRLSGVETDRIEVHVVGTNRRATVYRRPIAAHQREGNDDAPE